MSFCCITSCPVKAVLLEPEHGPLERPLEAVYLVQDIPLAAQVQVRQDPGRSHTGDREAGLGDAGRDQEGLPLTQTRKELGELQEAPSESRQAESQNLGWEARAREPGLDSPESRWTVVKLRSSFSSTTLRKDSELRWSGPDEF